MAYEIKVNFLLIPIKGNKKKKPKTYRLLCRKWHNILEIMLFCFSQELSGRSYLSLQAELFIMAITCSAYQSKMFNVSFKKITTNHIITHLNCWGEHNWQIGYLIPLLEKLWNQTWRHFLYPASTGKTGFQSTKE